MPAPSTPAAPLAAYCDTPGPPALAPSFAPLEEQLGETMGEPGECPHTDADIGDLQQRTTTGLAWQAAGGDLVGFTDGYRHWELRDDGLVFSEAPERPFLAVKTDAWTRSIRCPILYGHEVPSAPALGSLVTVLMNAGYRPTTLARVEAAMTGRADPPPDCLVLTLDDGLLSQFVSGLPALRTLGVPATFFVLPGFADGVHRYMGGAEYRALRDAGMEVMAHTCHHADLPRLARVNPVAFFAELADCKRDLENVLGQEVPYVAYPNGSYDAGVMAAAERAGYHAGFSTRASALLTPAARFALPRIQLQVGEAPARVLARIRAAGG
jgi:peptidoglycan/xylan/chitin deacetylase (PgdA/CDA1 family)